MVSHAASSSSTESQPVVFVLCESRERAAFTVDRRWTRRVRMHARHHLIARLLSGCDP